jgi:RNA polymerase sigma-70 factor, ECF subfamily
VDWPELYRRLSRDANDEAAWNELVRRVHEWARRALWQRGSHVVDDVVQDTCAAVVMNLPKARQATTFAGFAYGYFLNERRRHLAAPLLQPLAEDFSPDDSPGSSLGHSSRLDPLDDERDARLAACLTKLPRRERQAVELRYIEDLSTATIASVLEVTEGNARQLVFRGLRALRRCLGEGATMRASFSGSVCV